MINGNIDGIKKTYLKVLDDLQDKEFDKNLLIDIDVLKLISNISGKINREISIYINRKGRVILITVGDNQTVSLTSYTEKRDMSSLSGIRCIHTHPNGSSSLSNIDKTALFNLKFDLMAAVSVENDTPSAISVGYVSVENGNISPNVNLEGPYSINEIEKINWYDKVQNIESSISSKIYSTSDSKDKTIIVGGIQNTLYTPSESLDELQDLVEAAGGIVVKKVMQNNIAINPATYIGSGKAKELSLIAQTLSADLVVFDDELSGAQVKNLSEIVGCRIIDRTALILDIFAKRAKSIEGKIQVELAQLKYMLPRLIGIHDVLSRTGGGIGTRGPGEKKLETDRRHIRERIYELEKELKTIKKNRTVQQKLRSSNNMPIVALAGYTNAGKSTLRNKLCEIYGSQKYDVFVADMLFATLDTTTRMIKLPSGKDVLVSDTVGFIRKLPHDLIEAFKSTLTEVVSSNIIIHVVDASSTGALAQIATVNEVLSEIGASNKNIILVFNKIDKASETNLNILRGKFKDAIEISALNNLNIDKLINKIENALSASLKSFKLLIPFSSGNLVSYLHENNCVKYEEYKNDGIYLEIEGTDDVIGRVKQYIIKD